MDGLYWKTLLKWMIWGENPLFSETPIYLHRGNPPNPAVILSFPFQAWMPFCLAPAFPATFRGVAHGILTDGYGGSQQVGCFSMLCFCLKLVVVLLVQDKHVQCHSNVYLNEI